MILLDFIRMIEIRHLTERMQYLDRSEVNDNPNEVKKVLQDMCINSISIGEGMMKFFLV